MTNVALPPDVPRVPLKDLVPYARNARTHSAEQVRQIAVSMTRFGFNAPVLVDASNGIVAGHGRVLAAQSLGLKDVPVVRLGHLSEDQKRAYILADNQLGMTAGWDMNVLAQELDAITSAGAGSLDGLGFSDEQVDALLAGLNEDVADLTSGLGGEPDPVSTAETGQPYKPAPEPAPPPAGEAFAPNYNPDSAPTSTTGADVDRARERLENQFAGTKNQREMVCPHCAEVFYIDQ